MTATVPPSAAPSRDKHAIFYVHPDRIKPGNSLVWTLFVHRSPAATAVGTNSYQVRGRVKPCDPVLLRPKLRLNGGG